MSHPFGEQTARRRALGAALRRLRTDAGLSGEEIAALTGLSQSRVSRIELGQQSVSIEVAQTWARTVGASKEELAEVTELAEAAATQAGSWRGHGLSELQQASGRAEAGATTLLNYQTQGIAGLLQVPGYSRLLIAAGYPRRGPEEVAAAVKARMDRQVILHDEGRHFEFVMNAAALYWRPGPATLMRAQLDRLSAVTSLDNVTLGIIPLGTEVPDVWCDHSFNVLDGPEPVVHVETLTAPVNITDPDDVEAYRDVFRHLQAVSVTGADAREVIAEASRAL